MTAGGAQSVPARRISGHAGRTGLQRARLQRGENGLSFAHFELAGRFDIETRDHAVFDDHRIALRALAESEGAAVHLETDGPRELAAGQDSLPVRFVSESGGVRVTKTYTFHRGRYDIDVAHEVANIGDAPVTPSVTVT